MGMFDSFYDEQGREWQTKAYDRILAEFRVGDRPPDLGDDYQVEVLGDSGYAYATVRAGRVAAIGVARDRTLPLIGYSGGLAAEQWGDRDRTGLAVERDEYGIPTGEHRLTCGCRMRGRALLEPCERHRDWFGSLARSLQVWTLRIESITAGHVTYDEL